MTNLPLSPVSETPTKLVLGHDPVPGAIGFRTSPVVKNGQVQPGKWAHTWDGAATQHAFAPGHEPYRVQAIMPGPEGVYPAAAPPPPPVAANGAGYMRWGGITISPNTDRFGWVFASGGSEYQAAKALKNARVVIYKSILSASTKTDGRNYGLTGQQVLANGWAMLDTSGDPIYSSSFPDCVLIDVGNPAAQQGLADAIIAWAKGIPGVDGVFLDDVVAQKNGYASNPAKYDTDAKWEQAVVSAVNAVGAKVRAAGYYVIGNVYKKGGGIATAAFAARMKAGLNGAMFEYFPQFPDSAQGVKDVQAAGIDAFGLCEAQPDDAKCNASLATFLGAWNGSGGGFVLAPGSGDGWGSWAGKLGAK
jgi:hypothetical protein